MGCGSSQSSGDRGDGAKAPTKKGPRVSAMQKQIETYGYPPPSPPDSKKQDLFDLKKCKEMDSYASKQLPDDVLYGTYDEIAKYLIKSCTNDIQRLRSLFIWMTTIDIASLQSKLEKLPDEGRPLDYLLKIHWKMGNHAHFFTQLCRAAELPAIVVTGVNKSSVYQLGKPVSRKTMRGQWNCIYADGNWRFVDVFWATTCVVGKKSGDWNLMDIDGDMVDKDEEEDEGDVQHQVNEGYFLTDPEQLINTHLPDDPNWQLVDNPINIQTFGENVYIRERFYDMDQCLLPESYHKCVVQPKNGEMEFQFGLGNKIDIHRLQFTYELYRSRLSGEPPPKIPFERFVFFQKKGNTSSYSCRFPVTGIYRMDMFGKIEGEYDEYDLCSSYLIECDVAKPNCQPFPDCPENGWGPTTEAKALGITSETHPETIVICKDGIVEVKFKSTYSINVRHMLQSNNLDEETLKNQAYVRHEGDEIIVSMRLPKKGEYALDLFAAKEGTQGELPIVSNYLINVERDNPSLKPFPKLHNGNIGRGSYADTLGVKATTEPSGKLKTENGKLNLEFHHENGVEMFCEISHSDLDSELLSKSANVTNTSTATSMDVDLPLIGEYSINVYARMKNDPSSLYHAHTYLVDSRQTTKGQVKVSKDKPSIIPGTTNDDKVVLHLAPTENEILAELQKKNTHTPMEKDQIKCKKSDSEALVLVKLPNKADYNLDVFEKKPNGTLFNIASYELTRCEKESAEAKSREAVDESSTAAVAEAEETNKELSPWEKKLQEQQLAQERAWQSERDALKAAVSTQDQAVIAAAIAKFEASKTPDEKGQLDKAKEVLTFLQISTELTDAMAKRDLDRLEKSCEAAEKQGIEKKLGLQLKMAVKVRDQLRRLERLRHAILNLDQKTIAEIKSYSKPPEGIHKVMAAAFLLLGNSESEVKEWPKVVVLIGKTGKESLKRRITQDFKVEKLKLNVAKKAKTYLKGFELDFIRDLSAGAATFYVWASGMIEECEYRNS